MWYMAVTDLDLKTCMYFYILLIHLNGILRDVVQ